MTHLTGDRATTTVAVVFALAVVAAFLLPQWGVLTPDTKPELYLNPSRMLGRELSSWRPVPALGSPNYHPGIAPITALVWGIQQLGAAPWLSQRLLAILLTLLAAAGGGLLVSHLTGRRDLVPVTAGIAYALHPYAIVAGATLPIRLPHAILPWFVLAGILALRRGSWRWPAIATLAYAAMGGINGGIVNLLLSLSLPVVAVFVSRTDDLPGRVVLRRAAAIAALCVIVSLYWLVPTLLAAGSAATDVAATTEAPAAVAGTSSPIESLRGLGMWTLYLVLGGRPEVPAHIGYLTNAWLVTATLGLPVLAAVGVAVGRARARLLGVGLLVVALPVMIGMHPPEQPSPLGRLLGWAFEHVPGAIGFRTTNKVGSMLALGVAILVGGAVVARWRSRTLAPVVLGVVVLAATPLWVGRAQPVTLDVPDYWQAAAADLDTDDPGRLLFAPGNFQARYDWGYGGVDDLDTALFDHREVVWRPTVPAGSRPAHNLLTAFDVGMNTGALGPEAAATYLSLLGVSDVLVRADSENTRDGAATAASLLETYIAIDGAEVARTWGPSVRQLPDLADPAPATPALTQVSLPPGRPATLVPLADSLVVAGDAFAIGDLVAAGYSLEDRALVWVDELSAGELTDRLAAGGRIVLTDTNQRRRWDVRGLDRSHSPILRADEPLEPAETRARTIDATTQTTAHVEGGINITSSADTAGLFRLRAASPPSFAADGDPSTTWVTGAFDTARDVWIRLDYGVEVPLDPVRIEVDTTRDRVPTRLQATTEDDTFLVDVPRDGLVEFEHPGSSSWIRLDVVRVDGPGTGSVGFRDISVDGRSIHTGMALPAPLPPATGPAPREAVADAPVDVLLTRMQGDPSTPEDDEEQRMLRTFRLPEGIRTMAVTATVRPTAPPDDLLDALALTTTAITSTSPTVDGPLGRATQAFDRDPGTAWQPAGQTGALTATTAPPVRASRIRVDRAPDAGPALLLLDTGEQVHEIPLRGPRTTFRFPEPVRTDEVRLTVSAPALSGQVPAITDIELADIRTRPITATTRLSGCVTIGDVDGNPIDVRVDAPVEGLTGSIPVQLDGCAPIHLEAGDHRLETGLGWRVDQVVLRDEAPAVDPSGVRGSVELLEQSRTSRRFRVTTEEAAILSTGVAWDPRWEASLDGEPLGPPVLAQGHAVGWLLPAGDHDVAIAYGPQRPVLAGMVTSGAAVLVLALVAAWPPRGRR